VLEFTDQPYKFFPPHPNRLFIRLARWANHHFILPGPNHRISDLQIEGDERVSELVDRGARILFLPNHSTHSDPQIMSEVHRRLSVSSSFMAAYDVFLRSKFSAWCMQRSGCFSVDREGSDRKAMSTAIAVLKGAGALTIFPEGNVYFTNDRVTPFLDGAAFVGIKAQKDLGGEPPVFVVPVAMKMTHILDQRQAVLARLEQVAEIAGSRLNPSAPPLSELRRIGQIILKNHLREHGFEVSSEADSLETALEEAARTLIEALEGDIGLDAESDASLLDRLRKIRSKIHQIRISQDSDIDSETAAAWADRAILAMRMLGYTGSYVSDSPSIDRFAETVEKLTEDLRSEAPEPYGKRRAIVRLCEPIDLREIKGRSAVSSLTRLVETAVQKGLDDINASNRSAGSRRFDPPAQSV
jgi:1-acyl-sn-glycerol-3-phosphate acyltransferase